ncbi:MAG: nucleotidyltransferase family protein [Candidatus Cryptobacteroides sp.]
MIDIEELMGRIRDDLMTKQDVRLLRMALSEHPSQEELDEFLTSWDFEAEGASKSLLLSYFLKEHPELTLPGDFALRLKGLLDCFRFQNIRLIAQFRKIASRLAQDGIRVTIFKGGAMKHLRPQLSRRMSDIDVLVDRKDYKPAGKVIEEMGYDVGWDEHSFDVHAAGSEDGILDVHKYIPLLGGHQTAIMDDILGRAVESDIFGVKGRILTEEDLVFSLLVNLSRNIMNNTSTGGILFTFLDIRYLVDSKKDFDWEIVSGNAVRSGSEEILIFAVRFINSVVPGLLPEPVEVSERQMQDFAATVKYRRYLLCPLQARSHELGLGTVLRSPSLIPAFIKVRPRYSFLKLFRKHPRIAGKILSVHGSL